VNSITANRPFDMLNKAIDRQVMIELKGNKTVSGILKSFDVHLNLVVEDAEITAEGNKSKHSSVFVRGDSIIYISG
jgi:small nuclear ribonucleoprotein